VFGLRARTSNQNGLGDLETLGPKAGPRAGPMGRRAIELRESAISSLLARDLPSLGKALDITSPRDRERWYNWPKVNDFNTEHET
jgi:hypothetical protein